MLNNNHTWVTFWHCCLTWFTEYNLLNSHYVYSLPAQPKRLIFFFKSGPCIFNINIWAICSEFNGFPIDESFLKNALYCLVQYSPLSYSKVPEPLSYSSALTHHSPIWRSSHCRIHSLSSQKCMLHLDRLCLPGLDDHRNPASSNKQ